MRCCSNALLVIVQEVSEVTSLQTKQRTELQFTKFATSGPEAKKEPIVGDAAKEPVVGDATADVDTVAEHMGCKADGTKVCEMTRSCPCGNEFMQDTMFCRKCGLRRVRKCEKMSSPCCAQSLEVAMILSNLHSVEQPDPKKCLPREKGIMRIIGGSGDYDEDWYEDPSRDLSGSCNSSDNCSNLFPQSANSLQYEKKMNFESTVIVQRMLTPPRSLQDVNNGSAQQKSTMRTGKWSIDEEQFARALVSHFRSGSLNISPCTTLRSYLAEKLDCVSCHLHSEPLYYFLSQPHIFLILLFQGSHADY